MGQEGSIQAPQYTVKDGFERDQFQKQHNANHPELVLQQLSSIGTDLSKISPKVPIPMAVPHPKILFIICNTYTTEQYKLGSGPLNDSLAVASFLKPLGYTIFYLHNSTSKIFVEWFRHILKNATTDLTLFFAGYACHPKENEESEKNEVMMFDDGYIKDEELSDLLSQCRGPSQRTVLLSDCCHSGTIWNLQSFKKEAPQNVLSISSAKDSQGTLDSKDQGIFTLYFWKAWVENPSITVKQMKEKISTPLSKYELHLDYYSTTPELEDQPIFAKPEEAPAKSAQSKPAPAKPARLTMKPATSAKAETQSKPTTTSKPKAPAAEPKVTERAAPTPEVKEEKPAEPEVKEEKPAEPEVKEEKPAEPEVAAKEQAPPQEPAKEEKPNEDKKEKSSSDEDDKSSSSDDEAKKDKKEKSSSDDEDDKSSSDNEDKKGKSSSDEKSSGDENDKSSDDEDDKSD